MVFLRALKNIQMLKHGLVKVKQVERNNYRKSSLRRISRVVVIRKWEKLVMSQMRKTSREEKQRV